MIVPRNLINERLRLSKQQSCRLFRGRNIIDSNVVVSALNSCREGGQPEIEGDSIPRGLITITELAESLSNEYLAVTTRQVWNWTRRLYPVPHYRLTRNILLFSRSHVEQWIRGEIKSMRES